MSIGSRIKELRNKKGISQAELAEIFNVTAQSISKWENETSSPDIGQLPAIASYFGITIDELFAYPDDLEYQRIEAAIEQNYPMGNEQFMHSEDFLLREIKKDPSNHRAVSVIADLYHFHACRLNDKAVYFAEAALKLKPDNKFDLNTLNNASEGWRNDWNVSCHAKLINKYYGMLRENPKLDRVKLYLMDNLIADGRMEEAKRLLADNPELKLSKIYGLWIKEVEYGFASVKNEYEELMKTEPEWEILMEIANRFSFNSEYDLAIKAYERAFEIAPKPRYTDMLAAIAWINRVRGNNDEAVKAYKREIELLKDEWGITKGELIDSLKDSISTLS